MSPESIFPRLAVTPHQITSPPTPGYNCFAWAGGEDHRWWEAHPDAGHYWPTGPTADWSVDVVVAAYATLGYVVCLDDSLEPGIEKLAIYVKNGDPTHAARQLPNGNWASKLGAEEDIEHTLDGLIGHVYGRPEVFLARPITS